ncbi:hypothetical protein HKBW3S47_02128, partial [Candidatus Hakubella thermalkaliphila]
LPTPGEGYLPLSPSQALPPGTPHFLVATGFTESLPRASLWELGYKIDGRL